MPFRETEGGTEETETRVGPKAFADSGVAGIASLPGIERTAR